MKDATISNSLDVTGATIIGLVIPPGSIPPLSDVLISGNSAGLLNIDMNSNQIVNLANPVLSTDAANKFYVDDWDISVERMAYVSKSGSNLIGNGGPKLPWTSIDFAMSQISLIVPTPTDKIQINVGPGDFTENLTIIPNITINGSSVLATLISGNIDYNDSSWGGLAANSTTIQYLSITGTVTVDLAIQLATNAVITFQQIRFLNLTNITLFSMSSACAMINCIFNNDLTGSGGVLNILNSEFFGNVSVNSSVLTQTLLIATSSGIGGILTVTWTVLTLAVDAFLNNCLARTLILDGASCTCNATVSSIPILSSVSILNSAILININDAFGLGYTPTTPADWSIVPVNCQEALDTLATDVNSIVSVSAANYVPVISGLINLISVTLINSYFTQIGDIVTVHLVGTLQTSAIGACQFNSTLPASVLPTNNFPANQVERGVGSVTYATEVVANSNAVGLTKTFVCNHSSLAILGGVPFSITFWYNKNN